MNEERRKHPRVVLSQLIEMSLMHEHYVQAETVNVSEGGLLCRSNSPVEPLTTVYLMLSIPTEGGDYMLKTEGAVMHLRKEGEAYTFGIAFSALNDKDRETLRGYTASRDA